MPISQVVVEPGHIEVGKLTEQLDEALDVLSMTHPRLQSRTGRPAAGSGAVASIPMSQTDVALRYPGGELPLPVVPASEGAEGIDTSKLLATTGKVALDIGFVNTAACTSAITYIDGDAGILRYRGY